MVLSELFGGFADWPLLLWVLLVSGLVFWGWRSGLLRTVLNKWNGIIFVAGVLALLGTANQLGGYIHAPLPVMVVVGILSLVTYLQQHRRKEVQR